MDKIIDTGNGKIEYGKLIQLTQDVAADVNKISNKLDIYEDKVGKIENWKEKIEIRYIFGGCPKSDALENRIRIIEDWKTLSFGKTYIILSIILFIGGIVSIVGGQYFINLLGLGG